MSSRWLSPIRVAGVNARGLVRASCLMVALATFAPAHAQPAGTAPVDVDRRIDALTDEVRQLRELVQKLNGRIDELKSQAAAPVAGVAQAASLPAGAAPPAAAPTGAADVLHGVTVNAMLDGYYAYNVNSPIGRVNYLRAYDVSSDSFSLNQADLLIESAPDLAAGKRFGMRVDLQYGQATETLQGNSANELRPDVYRNLFQAYGTYVMPIRGTTLQVDFGKWASSIGLEGNYTKDQMNYSRSLWFDYLPFYHSGLRAALKVNDALTVNYWITNGTEQTEAFNNYKDELIGVVLTPTPALNWVLNYYVGQEHPDITYLQAGAPGTQHLPTQQGTPFQPITNPPDGKLRIADTYATWQATAALTFAVEAAWVVDRLYSYSPGQYTLGGALYSRYQASPQVAFAARAEYLNDRGGLYSGLSQVIREGTLTTEYRFVDGFLARAEFRRDATGQPYFLSDALGVLRGHQDTYTLGLVWWLGGKEGVW